MAAITRTIRQKVLIPASPKRVYDAMLSAKQHSAFTGAKATCNPKVGGRFTAWDGYISGKILELKPGKRIVQESPERATENSFVLPGLLYFRALPRVRCAHPQLFSGAPTGMCVKLRGLLLL